MLLRQIVVAQGVRGRGESVRVMVAGGLQRGPSRGEQYLVRFARCSNEGGGMGRQKSQDHSSLNIIY